MSKILSFSFLLLLLTSCAQKNIRDMSCSERCQYDYNSTFNQLKINEYSGYTEKRVDEWSADQRKNDCLERCRASESKS